MPNRILKESICTSADIEKLNWREEVFMYRLIVQCDDYGRFPADPTIIRSRCFPRRLKQVTEREVTRMLQRLIAVGLIRFYENGKWFLYFPSWPNHQNIRAKRSRYPDPPADDSSGQQVLAHVPVLELVSRISNSYLDTRGGSPAANGRSSDEVFEALIEISHWELTNLTKDARGETNRAAKQLREVGATPPLIRGFEDIWNEAHPDVPIRPQTVVSHWAAYMAGEVRPLPARGRR